MHGGSGILGCESVSKNNLAKPTNNVGLEGGLVNKVFTFQAGGAELDSQNLWEIQVHWCTGVRPALGKWNQEDPGGSLAGQFSLFGEVWIQ